MDILRTLQTNKQLSTDESQSMRLFTLFFISFASSFLIDISCIVAGNTCGSAKRPYLHAWRILSHMALENEVCSIDLFFRWVTWSIRSIRWSTSVVCDVWRWWCEEIVSEDRTEMIGFFFDHLFSKQHRHLYFDIIDLFQSSTFDLVDARRAIDFVHLSN